MAAVAAVVLVLGGVIQNLAAPADVTGVTGATQSIPGGLVASQEAIKELGTNGGGFFNANSAHPFENPNGLTNLVEIFLLLVIPFALPRAYGIMVGDRRQGHAILAFMTVLWGASVALTTWAEVASGTREGKETRFGIWSSTLFAASTTATSTGAVNSLHESYSPLGGGVLLLNMMLGRGLAGRHRFRPLRRARRGGHRRVHRRPDGRVGRRSCSARRSGGTRSPSARSTR